jgi:uncharacterized protein YdeI (YjbR/CyaY-like superfamily)
MTPKFFQSADAFRAWLDTHGTKARELWVGFYRKGSGRGGLTYPEAVDAALCFGWIDGVKYKVDESSYKHRFTPRRAGSYWSAVNTKRMQQLLKDGLAAPPGVAAFERRDVRNTQKYSFERKSAAFDGPASKAFKANKPAWTFFTAQPPGYQKLLTHWVMDAKQPETRLRRLATLIERSAKGERIR